jgi:hypothetical protein
MLANAAIATPVIAPSHPPVSITSATPLPISCHEVPMACALEEHADTVAKLGP